MNILAHSFLSASFDDAMLGNLMGDFVKGKPDMQLGSGILQGIDLHRKIDSFTDTHPVVRASKSRLFPTYRHYASVIVDVFYDHFLAVGWQQYSTEPLREFAQKVYGLLQKKHTVLPKAMQRMFFYMQSQNWLVSYASVEGIEQSLQGMAQRTTFRSGMEYAIRDLKKDYGLYEEEFRQYFPQLIQYVEVVKTTF
jgi:acyl carrier protein phosphodiesterase